MVLCSCHLYRQSVKREPDVLISQREKLRLREVGRFGQDPKISKWQSSVLDLYPCFLYTRAKNESRFEKVSDLGSDGISVLCVTIDTRRRGMLPVSEHVFWWAGSDISKKEGRVSDSGFLEDQHLDGPDLVFWMWGTLAESQRWWENQPCRTQCFFLWTFILCEFWRMPFMFVFKWALMGLIPVHFFICAWNLNLQEAERPVKSALDS